MYVYGVSRFHTSKGETGHIPCEVGRWQTRQRYRDLYCKIHLKQKGAPVIDNPVEIILTIMVLFLLVWVALAISLDIRDARKRSSRPNRYNRTHYESDSGFDSTDYEAAPHGGITLLRDNKFLVVAEVIFVCAFLFIMPYLKFVGLTSALLVVMGLLWLSGNTWSKLGMARPSSWRRTVVIGLSAGLFFVFLKVFIGVLIIRPLVHMPPNMQAFSSVYHNIVFFIGVLISSWTEAAFAEEMIFRGYLMNRLADLFGHNFLGWTIALVVQAVVFASIHSYQGLAGMLSTGLGGILLGLLYLSTKRNLWNCVIAHGLNDTIASFFLFVLP